jgi:recombination protein RecT
MQTVPATRQQGRPPAERRESPTVIVDKMMAQITNDRTHMTRLQQILPRGLNAQRFLEVFRNALLDNPQLIRCNRASIFRSIKEAAMYGLECNGVLGEAYLVPYKDECVLVPGWKGKLKLAYASGMVDAVRRACVYMGDGFDYALGDTPFLRHTPSKHAQRAVEEITHVYVIVELKEGPKLYHVMTSMEVETHKEKYSKAWQKKDSAWQTAWPAMAMKTCFLQLYPMIPMHASIGEMIARESQIEEATVDATALPVAADSELFDQDYAPPRIQTEPPSEPVQELQEERSDGPDSGQGPHDADAGPVLVTEGPEETQLDKEALGRMQALTQLLNRSQRPTDVTQACRAARADAQSDLEVDAIRAAEEFRLDEIGKIEDQRKRMSKGK